MLHPDRSLIRIGIQQAKLAGYSLCVYISHPQIQRYPALFTNSEAVADEFISLALAKLSLIADLYLQLNSNAQVFKKLESLCEELRNEAEKNCKEAQRS